MKKFLSAASAGVIALASISLMSTANASVVVSDTDGVAPNLLSPTSAISIRNSSVVLAGPLVEADNFGSFMTSTDLGMVSMSVDVNDTTGQPAGIANFMIEFFADAAKTVSLFGPLQLTDSLGAEFDPAAVYNFSLPAGTEVFFQATGFGQSINPAFSGDYNIRLLGSNAVPIPAAAVLFGTAILGAGVARRKRKIA